MKHELRVGFTVIGGIFLLYGIIAWANRMHFFAPAERNYDIVFDNVSGLLEGDPVSVRGYISGRVLEIQPAATFVQVRIAVDDNIDLRQDAYGEIQLKELMGGKQLALIPGQSAIPYDASSPLSGRTSLDFTSAFSRMGQFMDELNPEHIRLLVSTLDTFTRSLTAMSGKIDTESLLSLPRQLSATMGRVEQLLASVERNELIGKSAQTLSRADSLLQSANQAISRFEGIAATAEATTLPRLDTLMQRSLDMLSGSEELLGSVSTIFEALEQEETFAGRMLHDPAFANRVDSTLKHLDDVLLQIKEERIYVAIKLGKRKK